jgi:amidase
LEIWRAHSQWIQKENPTFGPGIAERFASASSLRDEDGTFYNEMREDIKKRMIDLLGEDGILIIPTAPGIAPLLQQSGEELDKRRAKTLQLTCIAGLAGLPQITIPMTSSEGSVYGISMIAGPRQDIKLLTWANEIDHLLIP